MTQFNSELTPWQQSMVTMFKNDMYRDLQTKNLPNAQVKKLKAEIHNMARELAMNFQNQEAKEEMRSE